MPPLVDMTDEKLYRRYLHGSEDALRVLVDRHGESLTQFLIGIVHDPCESRNLMHESFAIAATTKRLFIGKSTFRTWLFGIGKNLALQEMRRKKNAPEAVLDAADLQIAADDETPDERLLRKEDSGELRAALQKLPQDYREALDLVYFQDMSYADAGEIMSKNQKQVSNLVYRGKQQLKKLLDSSNPAGSSLGL